MSRFVTRLEVELIADDKNDGRGVWRVTLPLVYESDIAGKITVPAGFVTDFASVPRIPVAYWLAGDTAHEAAVIHDFLYTAGETSRATADAVLREAMAVSGVPEWRRQVMYLAVRLFGRSRFGGSNASANS